MSNNSNLVHNIAPNNIMLNRHPDQPMVLAVDFDGTLFEDAWPDVGAPIPVMLDAVRRASRDPDIEMLIWTCRVGTKASDAYRACIIEGVTVAGFNKPAPSNIAWMNTNPRKVWADFYYDDKAFGWPGHDAAAAHIHAICDMLEQGRGEEWDS